MTSESLYQQKFLASQHTALIFRQGVIFIPALFLMKAIIGVDGLIWAQPVADVLSLAIVLFMLWRKISRTDFSKPEQS